MKSDMTDARCRAMVRALARHFYGMIFDFSQIPYRACVGVLTATSPASFRRLGTHMLVMPMSG
jgi:hypothetical protein